MLRILGFERSADGLLLSLPTSADLAELEAVRRALADYAIGWLQDHNRIVLSQGGSRAAITSIFGARPGEAPKKKYKCNKVSYCARIALHKRLLQPLSPYTHHQCGEKIVPKKSELSSGGWYLDTGGWRYELVFASVLTTLQTPT